MDIISRIFENFFQWAGSLQPATVNFLLRAVLLFGIPCLICRWTFARGSRFTMIQWLGLAVGVLLTALLPVEKVSIASPVARGCMVTILVVLLCFLPGILPSLVVPRVGAQRRLRLVFYLTLGALFLLNLFQHGGR